MPSVPPINALTRMSATAKDIFKDHDNPSGNQIRDLFEGLRKVQKFKGF
jgi:hypothetical protein